MVRVIKKEDVTKENVRIISQFSSEDYSTVEMVQEFDCETTTIQCYNLVRIKELYKLDYGIVVYDKRTGVSSYAYFNAIKDMFAYYDVLHKHFSQEQLTFII
jgi:hypothetical protein